METISVRDDEVELYKVLPETETSGTAYDYYLKFGGFDEELYYILECCTRQNADPDKLVELCRDIVDTRQKSMLDQFYNKLEPNEITVDLEDILYNTNEQFPDSSSGVYEFKSVD